VASSNENIEGAAKMLLECTSSSTSSRPKRAPTSAVQVSCSPTGPSRAQRRRFPAARLSSKTGGKLLLSHEALLDHATGNFALADLLGVDYQGPASSVPDYFIVPEPTCTARSPGPASPTRSTTAPSARVAPQGGTKTLADAYETYFNRTGEHFISHGFTRPSRTRRPTGRDRKREPERGVPPRPDLLRLPEIWPTCRSARSSTAA
jgi:hypothetical protein